MQLDQNKLFNCYFLGPRSCYTSREICCNLNNRLLPAGLRRLFNSRIKNKLCFPQAGVSSAGSLADTTDTEGDGPAQHGGLTFLLGQGSCPLSILANTTNGNTKSSKIIRPMQVESSNASRIAANATPSTSQMRPPNSIRYRELLMTSERGWEFLTPCNVLALFSHRSAGRVQRGCAYIYSRASCTTWIPNNALRTIELPRTAFLLNLSRFAHSPHISLR